MCFKWIGNKRVVIIIGAGRVGMASLEYLVEKKAEIIVVENSRERARNVKERFPEVQVELIENEEEINKILSEKIDGMIVAAPIKRLKMKKKI